MKTINHALWLSDLKQHRPASLEFYQYRIAELAANFTEISVFQDKKGWNTFWDNIEKAHQQALNELRRKHPSFKGISQIPLNLIPDILTRHWLHAKDVYGLGRQERGR